ncbi:hypothetical protein [Qipengyuania spongiae]|uniref:Uncharacterized protein n=1 Tax=Qipengyuania spongiae TaxID=2909673 RepID=A0ABY5SW79_9SPHN|nr:hypothetical protein [Qipengyuania spongiae]UVI38405.1 hypothetical protein L1F33_09035 [Qipengyuania spongiae]
MNYRHPNFTKESWSDTFIKEGRPPADLGSVLDFFSRLNGTLLKLGGYSPRFRSQLDAVGTLKDHSRIRYFRGDTGEQYVALSSGTEKPLAGDSVVNAAVILPFYTVRPIRGLRVINVHEEGILHVHVDADFDYRGDPLDGYRKMMKSYEAGLA